MGGKYNKESRRCGIHGEAVETKLGRRTRLLKVEAHFRNPHRSGRKTKALVQLQDPLRWRVPRRERREHRRRVVLQEAQELKVRFTSVPSLGPAAENSHL